MTGRAFPATLKHHVEIASPDRNIRQQERHRAEVTASSSASFPWLVAVAFFMESLDTTILNTAVPTIAEALGVAPLSMKAVLTSYTLSLAVFIPISGWVADRFGTRRVFASAIGLFTLGSLLCGISSEHPRARRLPHPAGMRRRDDGAGRTAHAWCALSPSPSSSAR